MKRVGNLWQGLTSFANLLAAFLMNLEPELWRLRRELQDGSYQPGSYRLFGVPLSNRS